ncbi:MAG: hypothetical protein QNJ97_20240 [Myxococcota bacterium]|nr:hypothetical protein [Myxococcota bacterium]
MCFSDTLHVIDVAEPYEVDVAESPRIASCKTAHEGDGHDAIDLEWLHKSFERYVNLHPTPRLSEAEQQLSLQPLVRPFSFRMIFSK